MNAIRRMFRWVVVGVLTLLVSGCLLQGGLLSYLIISGPTGFGNLTVDVITADCQVAQSPGVYRIKCGVPFNDDPSTIDLIAEFGLLGLIIDPMIIEVPIGMTAIQGTFNGAGTSGNLVVTEVTGALPVDATRQYVVEPGRKLVIIDFPSPPMSGQQYTFSLNYSIPSAALPVQVKAVFAAKLSAGGVTYYPPLFPCESNFANLPALTLPTANMFTAVNLTAAASLTACQGTAYTFTPGAAATVNVVEYYNQTLDHYFITWIAAERQPRRRQHADALDAHGQHVQGLHDARRPARRRCAATTFRRRRAIRISSAAARPNATRPGRPIQRSCSRTPKFMQLFLPTAGNCRRGHDADVPRVQQPADANHRYMTDRACATTMVGQGLDRRRRRARCSS